MVAWSALGIEPKAHKSIGVCAAHTAQRTSRKQRLQLTQHQHQQHWEVGRNRQPTWFSRRYDKHVAATKRANSAATKCIHQCAAAVCRLASRTICLSVRPLRIRLSVARIWRRVRRLL